MPKYGMSVGGFTTSTSQKTAISVRADGTGERGELIELIMTGAGTVAAADTQHRAAAYFVDGTTAGTSTAATAEKFSDGSPAALCLTSHSFTAEPTNVNTVAQVMFGFNQRGGMRWAVPQGEGLLFNNAFGEKGVVWTVISQAAGSVVANVHWWE